MLDITKTYESKNYGLFRVISYNDCYNVDVEFLDTGYKTTAESGNIRNGQVKDKLLPVVYGVGYFGEGEHKAYVNGRHTKPYYIWFSMLSRCYGQKKQELSPTYKGCSVAKEWHNFQVFAEWFELNYVEGLHLDKDIIKQGNKVYGPDLCMFVTQTENNIEAKAKHYKFISPEGELTKIYNLSEFCRNSSLNQGAMGDVNSGKRNHHKGWTKYLK